MGLKLVVTEDGSHTILNEELQESYHSLRGAAGESTYVFIDKGLRHAAPGRSHLAVLEVGLGTGLNVLLTAREALRAGFPSVAMTSLEPEPLPGSLIEGLNHVPLLADFPQGASLFATIHGGEWERVHAPFAGFEFSKHRVRLEDFQPSRLFDVIYFDAFAPGKQADIWSEANLQKLFACLSGGGVLVTYCAQGAFRRSLRKAGFQTERLPGFGKREMTRATKPATAEPADDKAKPEIKPKPS